MLQFGDSMFPIGGFSFSCGLESAIQKGVVADAATLHAFTRTAVEQAARGDGIALIAAHRAAAAGDIDALIQIDAAGIRAQAFRRDADHVGAHGQEVHGNGCRRWSARRCLAHGANASKLSVTPGCYPVALAVNFAVQDLPARQAFVVHQYGVAATILGAALRLMKISHVETQKILYELNGGAEAAYETAAAARLSDMAGYAPLTEILAAVHAKAHVRLFMN